MRVRKCDKCGQELKVRTVNEETVLICENCNIIYEKLDIDEDQLLLG